MLGMNPLLLAEGSIYFPIADIIRTDLSCGLSINLFTLKEYKDVSTAFQEEASE